MSTPSDRPKDGSEPPVAAGSPKPAEASSADEPVKQAEAAAEPKGDAAAEPDKDAAPAPDATAATRPAKSSDSPDAPPSVEFELEPVRTTPPSKPPPRHGSSRPPADVSTRPLPPPGRKHPSEHSPPPPVAVPAPARQFPPEVVGDIMTRTLIAALETDTLESIEAGMKRFRFRRLPVVDGSNRLVGLVTRHEVLAGPPSAPAGSDGEPAARWDKGTTVGNMMRKDVLTTRPTTPLVQAGKALLQKRIGCLPVIEEDNTLVGIVTKNDFLKLAIELLEKLEKG